MDDRSPRREVRDAVWLALVPVGVAVVLGLLMAPRRAAPEAIPLPLADRRSLARLAAMDDTLAEVARRQPLSGPVRALGTAVREFHVLEAHDSDARALGEARRAVDLALVEALREGMEPLRTLRAFQLQGFVAEVKRFESTGEESAELQALAGGFIRSMRTEGWSEGHTLAASPPVLRVMFKEMWQRFLGLEGREALNTTLDEQRLLYAFYLSHPHPSKAMRDAIAAARRGARDAKSCQALVEAEQVAVESWRLERIGRFAAIDPDYPADYARGVASFRRGDYAVSARAFQTWLERHPEGPLAIRAQNYWRAATAEADRMP